MRPPARPQVVCAIPSPFDGSGALDDDAFRARVAHLSPHVDAVLVAGTSGEFPALTDEERLRLFEIAVEVLTAERVIAHVGHFSTHQVRRLLERARTAGLTRFAAISPLFFAVDDAATVSFYEELADDLDRGSLFAYLFPERTGNTTSAAALADILAVEAVGGVKLSGSAGDLLAPAVGAAPGKAVYSGSDDRLREVVELGGTGVVSGCAAARPEPFARLAAALGSGDAAAVQTTEAEVTRIVGDLGRSVAALKAELADQTQVPWRTRMTMAADVP